MKKEPLSIMIVKTLLAVVIFAGIGTIIIGGGYIIGEYYKNGNKKSGRIQSSEFTIKEKSALDPRCSEKVKGVGPCEVEQKIGYEFDQNKKICVKRSATGCSIKTPFKSLEECQKVCEKREDIALPDENELIKCDSNSDCVLVDPGKCDCYNCKTKAINKKYLDAWNEIQANQECNLEIYCPAVEIFCEPYKAECDNNKCIAVMVFLKKHY